MALGAGPDYQKDEGIDEGMENNTAKILVNFTQ